MKGYTAIFVPLMMRGKRRFAGRSIDGGGVTRVYGLLTALRDPPDRVVERGRAAIAR